MGSSGQMEAKIFQNTHYLVVKNPNPTNSVKEPNKSENKCGMRLRRHHGSVQG